ncbi:MAG: NADH-ubiquinone oxidoreductase-F iron-sulfur binding region domain-containing protein [Candidatus Woesearchaeota archaeon]
MAYEIDIDTSKAQRDLQADRITVGLATCGRSAGATPVYEKLKAAHDKGSLKLPVMETGCIGMCYNEPLVTVYRNGSMEVYGNVTQEVVDEFIDTIRTGERYDRLFLTDNLSKLGFYKKQKRMVLGNCGIIDPSRLDQYILQGGYAGLKRALEISPEQVVDEIDNAGLRGRGGAGFPTARKWRFITGRDGKKYIICNGDEGDPGAFMNRTLMESDPYRILEGMTIGAYATGADEGIIYTRAEYPLAIKTLQAAINKAYKNGLLGNRILGKEGFSFDIRIQQGAGAYVCGEETALIKSIEGERGTPRPRPPFPAQKGLFGYPTVVNNVGTWGHVAEIMRIGWKKYASVGSKQTRGTKILCLSGKINNTGVIEVPFGIKLKDIIYSIGGGMPDGHSFKALFPGGPAGGCIVAKDLDHTLDYESMSQLHTIMGSGSFIVTSDSSCMVNMAKYFLTFTTQESCGKCTPCREGTKRLLEMLTKVTRGVGKPEDIDAIEELASFINRNALCGLGQFAPNPVLSTIRHFRGEYEAHLAKKKCPAHVCENLLHYRITDKCVGCGNCKRHCPVDAISGELKGLHAIDQKKCIKCGQCYDNCAFDAIVKE